MTYRLTRTQIGAVVENGSKCLANYCMNGNLHYVVTGSSGGLDSAVTLGFAERACRIAAAENFHLTSVALILPCESEQEDTEKGLVAAEKFRARTITFGLEPMFDSFMTNASCFLEKDMNKILKETRGQDALLNWDWSKKVAQGNVKARMRMIAIYHVARMLKGMVLSTDNLSEFWMAFWTICGDVGDFNLIQNIMKGRELYDIAEFLGVPEAIIKAPPGDGLKVGGSAQDQLGADYLMIDTIMIRLMKYGFDPDGSFTQLERLPFLEGVDQRLVERIAERCLRGAYKRQGTITISRERLGLPAIKDIQL